MAVCLFVHRINYTGGGITQLLSYHITVGLHVCGIVAHTHVFNKFSSGMKYHFMAHPVQT